MQIYYDRILLQNRSRINTKILDDQNIILQNLRGVMTGNCWDFKIGRFLGENYPDAFLKICRRSLFRQR